MKAFRRINILCLFLLTAAKADETPNTILVDTLKGGAVASTTLLSQALGRVDLSIAKSRLNMKHLQGNFGEHHVAGYLNRGTRWIPMRQIVGRQGIDLIHLKVSPDGLISDLMISEVKTGGSALGMTKSGRQMSPEWISPRLKLRASQLRMRLSELSSGTIQLSKAPSALSSKHVLEIPLSNGESARFWRENNQSPWKLSAKPEQISLVQRQTKNIIQYFEAAADGKIDYRSRIFRQKIVNGKLVITVKDASLLGTGVMESKLTVLNRVELPLKQGGPTHHALAKAFSEELRRTQSMLTNREVSSQARELSKSALAGNLEFKPRSLLQSMTKGSGVTGAGAGIFAGVIDLGVQLWIKDDVDFKQVGANTLIGAGAGATGYLAGSGTTFILMETGAGLSITRGVATSMGMSTSCSANLLGSSVGGGLAAAVFSYGLYFMGYADLESANRMATAGVVGSVAGAAAMAATTSLVAAYGVAGTGTAISTLSGAAATSATMAAIGGGSAVAGTALAATGVGLVVVGVGAGVMWGFTAYDESQETERLELTAGYLLEHFGKIAR